MQVSRVGVQVVVDNHTIDDSLAAHGWGATKRGQHGQGLFILLGITFVMGVRRSSAVTCHAGGGGGGRKKIRGITAPPPLHWGGSARKNVPPL